MIVREADFEKDEAALIAVTRAFSSCLWFKFLFPEDDKEFAEAIFNILKNPNVETLVAEDNGKVFGGISVIYCPYIWNQKLLACEELFWWTNPGSPLRAGKMLMDEMMNRIEKKGAIAVFKALLASPKGVSRYYGRLGFSPVEISYMRVP